MIIDVWAKHPTVRFLRDPVFEPLMRWTRRQPAPEAPPVAATVAAMDAANVGHALVSAWVAPGKVMISNDEVHGFVAECPDRLIGVGSVE